MSPSKPSLKTVSEVTNGLRTSDAGGREIDRRSAVVGEAREGVALVGGGHADHVGGGDLARVVVDSRRVEVEPVIAGRYHEQRVRRNVDHVLQRLREVGPTEARIDDPRAFANRVEDRRHDRRGRAPVHVARPDRHQAGVPVDAGDTVAVVAARTDRAGHVRAMTGEIAGRVVGVDEIPATDVVDPPVAVVIDAVSGDLAGIAPDVRRQVRMVVRDSAVDDGNRDRGAAGRRVPRLRRVDIGVRRPEDAVDQLTRVVQPPQLRKARIVRDRIQLVEEVGLGVQDIGVALELRRRSPNRLSGRQPQQLEPRQRQRLP